jgi:hypothetical protein
VNYYNYFTEIEDTFIRRRGRHLLLSPIDWAMIEGWQERGIPLHIVLRGIESVFDNFDKNPKPRSIKSLLFCREEIEAQFAEWTAGQIGKGDAAGGAEENAAFSKEAITSHIERLTERLGQVNADHVSEEIDRAVSRLSELLANLPEGPEQIDGSLTDIENFLDQALLSKTEKQHLKLVEKDISGQMRAYKAEMEKAAYDNTFRLMLLKRLREDLGIPRMGLFYL